MRLICIELCSVQHEKCRMCEKCSAECRFDSHVWVVWINNATYVIMCMIARCQLSMHNSLDCQLNLPVQQLSAGLSVCLSVCLYVSVCLCVSIHLTVSSIYPLSYSTSVCLCCVNPATSVPVSPKLNFETSEKRTLMQKTSVHRKHKYKLWNAKRTHWDWTQKYCPFAKQPSVVLFYANSAPAHMIYQNVVNLELFHLKHIWCIFSSVLCKAAAAAVAAAAAQLGTLSLYLVYLLFCPM